MITTKSDEVIFRELTPGLAYILYHLEEFHRLHLVPQPMELVITAIANGNHMVNSRHYKNEAIDLRSKNFLSVDKVPFRDMFQKYLGDKFTVILESPNSENEHFHIQVRKGLQYIGV